QSGSRRTKRRTRRRSVCLPTWRLSRKIGRLDRSLQTDARAKPARPDGRRRRAGALDEQALEVEQSRPEDDDEHRREDEEDEREEHLDRRLHRLLLGRGLTLQARVRRLDAEDPPERDPELVGLDDRAREARDLRRVAPPGHLLQRLLAAL